MNWGRCRDRKEREYSATQKFANQTIFVRILVPSVCAELPLIVLKKFRDQKRFFRSDYFWQICTAALPNHPAGEKNKFWYESKKKKKTNKKKKKK